jgi:hypothetical protein
MRNDALTYSNELVLCESSLGKEQEKTRRSNDALPAINMTEIKIKYEYSKSLNDFYKIKFRKNNLTVVVVK